MVGSLDGVLRWSFRGGREEIETEDTRSENKWREREAAQGGVHRARSVRNAFIHLEGQVDRLKEQWRSKGHVKQSTQTEYGHYYDALTTTY